MPRSEGIETEIHLIPDFMYPPPERMPRSEGIETDHASEKIW